MKLHAKIDGSEREIEIARDDASVICNVEGLESEFEVSEPEPGLFVFKSGNRVHEVYVSDFDQSNTSTVIVGTEEFEIEISDPKRLRGSGKTAGGADGAAEIKTAMPGKVVRVLAVVGDSVALGDGIIVVEAMKMQNELKSPRDGVVRSISVEEGDRVNAGDVLVVVAPVSETV